MKILIVDDDRIIRCLLQNLLAQWGHEVVLAADGDEAWQLMQHAQSPQIAIIDWMLPGLSGVELLQRIRAQKERPYVYAIFLTSKVEQTDYLEAMAAGVDNYLTKPFDTQELRSVINVGIRIISLQQRLVQQHSETTKSEERLALALQGANDGVWDWNLATGATFFNPQCAEMLGYAPEKLGANIHDWERLVHPEDMTLVTEEIARHLAGEADAFCAEFRLLDHTGEWIWVMYRGIIVERGADGQPVRMVGTQTNINKQKLTELTLIEQAYYDQLTKLANRHHFSEHLSAAISIAKRNNSGFAVFFFDVDGFKMVNDTYGHAVGDALLQQFALRIVPHMRASDMVARVGGDEFSILAQGIVTHDDAAIIARKVLQVIATPFTINGIDISVSASIGVALFPIDAGDGEQLLQNADEAMYRAKKEGKNRYIFYNKATMDDNESHHLLKREVRKALREGEFVLYYQPAVDQATGEIVGVEVLVRWQHPRLGLLMPEFFFPIVSEAGLNETLGRWVLLTACRQAKCWEAEGSTPAKLTVNVSRPLFLCTEFLHIVEDILHETDFPAARLEIEIDERDIFGCSEEYRDIMLALQQIGVQTSIDHFGMSVSSFLQLKSMPVSSCKIARNITRSLGYDANSRLVAELAIDIAKKMNLHVVALGIENEHQMDFIRDVACDSVQGFHLYQPMDQHAIADLLKQPTPTPPRKPKKKAATPAAVMVGN